MRKYETFFAQIQCSGEARYTDDVPAAPEELQAAYVLTDRANADIQSVDVSVAMVRIRTKLANHNTLCANIIL